jgi:hypothetical protein
MASGASRLAIRTNSAWSGQAAHSTALARKDPVPSKPAGAHTYGEQRPGSATLPDEPSAIPANPAKEFSRDAQPGFLLRHDAALGEEQAAGGGTGVTGPMNQQGAGQQLQQKTGGTPRKGKVSAVTLIDSPTGALSGFPSLANVPDLNKPGPVNATTTGACQNVQQIRFDLSGIPNNEVDLLRTKDGVAGPVGQEQPRKGPDGPSDPTKLRQNSLIAVADTPGISKATSGFPLRYSMSFQLFAFDIVSKSIMAKATYKVNILKQSVGDTKPVNELVNFQSTIL